MPGFLFVVVTSISGILTAGVLMRDGGFFQFCCRPSPVSIGCEGSEVSTSVEHMRFIKRMEAMPKMESLANMMKKLDCREGVSSNY